MTKNTEERLSLIHIWSKNVSKLAAINLEITSKERAIPVSYTHLDVYKRQGHTHTLPHHVCTAHSLGQQIGDRHTLPHHVYTAHSQGHQIGHTHTLPHHVYTAHGQGHQIGHTRITFHLSLIHIQMCIRDSHTSMLPLNSYVGSMDV